MEKDLLNIQDVVSNQTEHEGLKPITFKGFEKKKNKENEFVDFSFLSTMKQIPLTNDEGIIKYVENTTENISDLKIGTKVNIIYDLFYTDGRMVQIPGKVRKEKFSFKIKKNEVCLALDIASSYLVKGEIAWFKVKSKYHSAGVRGTDGLFSEEIDLYYKIELVHRENPSNLENENNPKEAIQFLQDSKKFGNEFFEKKDFDNAIKEYSKGVNVLTNLPKKLLNLFDETQKKEILELEVSLRNNIAMNYIKKEKFRDAIKYLDDCIKKDPKNCKAFYRRAICFKSLGELEKMNSDFEECCKLDPSQISNKSHFKVEQAREVQKKDLAEEKIFYKKIFENLAVEEIREKETQKKQKAINRKLMRQEKTEEEEYY